MEWQRKQKIQVKLLWKKILAGTKAFREKLLLRVEPLRQRLRIGEKGWPRFWQIAALYLLVLFAAGGIYLWHTAQLRAINPYAEKIDFGERGALEAVPEDHADGDQEKPDEPAVSPALAGGSCSGKGAPECAFIWPVQGRSIIFEYGGSAREVLARMDEAVKWSFNRGLGIAAVPGEQVYAMGRGRVKEVRETGKPYGQELIVEHDNNLTVYYGALEQVTVKKGDQLSGGEPIATVKKSPQETGEVYLYLEIQADGRPVDPLQFLPHF